MKIYLLDINSDMTDAWKKYFVFNNIEIINEDFAAFMGNHPNIEAVVSPANSFGLMDGGYDRAIIDYFGKKLMDDVKKIIIRDWYGDTKYENTRTNCRCENYIPMYKNYIN